MTGRSDTKCQHVPVGALHACMHACMDACIMSLVVVCDDVPLAYVHFTTPPHRHISQFSPQCANALTEHLAVLPGSMEA
jgi:hypothetical protein